MPVEFHWFHVVIGMLLCLPPILVAIVVVIAVWKYTRSATIHLATVVGIISELVTALRQLQELTDEVFKVVKKRSGRDTQD